MNKETLPCIDCITLSICQALKTEKFSKSFEDGVKRYEIVFQLYEKCSIISYWLKYNGLTDEEIIIKQENIDDKTLKHKYGVRPIFYSNAKVLRDYMYYGETDE